MAGATGALVLTSAGGGDRTEAAEVGKILFEGCNVGQVEAVVNPAAFLATAENFGIFEGFEMK